MKYLSLVLVALFLAISPASAAKTKPVPAAPAPAPKSVTAVCHSPEAVIAKMGEKLLVKRLDGDGIKPFLKNVGVLNNEADTVTLFQKDGTSFMVFVVYVKGCMVGYGPLPASAYPGVFEDGSL